jgi:Cu/Ag efflux protein CusF
MSLTHSRRERLDRAAVCTKFWLSDVVAVDSVTEGSVVKVVYEEKDGKPVAMMIEIK